MASAIAKQPCIKCNKGGGIITCGGCQQWFCTRHLLEHRQELATEMDHVGQEHDLLQRDLIQENDAHPLLSRINDWEQKSIIKIQIAAEEARRDLQKHIDHTKSQLKTSLGRVTTELQASRESDDYTEIDLKKWIAQLKELQERFNKPAAIDITDEDETQPIIRLIQLKERSTTIGHFVNDRWIQHGITVAGGHGQGNGFNQLYGPHGLYVDDDQTFYIVDSGNHRIVEWKYGATSVQVVAGGNGRGNQNDQLKYPTDVIVDKNTDSLIICDTKNRRVMRWSRQNRTRGETIISNVDCQGLTIDDQGFFYVSDSGQHEVRRYRVGETGGTVVAGGNGKGNRLNQLNFPTNIFVDRDHSIYVSDSNNDRVMKWIKDAQEGIVVAGGRDKGNDLTQLSNPRGVVVDPSGTFYVIDGWNHRVIRWCNGASQGNVIVGGNGQGELANQLNYPESLSFDRHGNLYVVDCLNHRVQRFDIESS